MIEGDKSSPFHMVRLTKAKGKKQRAAVRKVANQAASDTNANESLSDVIMEDASLATNDVTVTVVATGIHTDGTATDADSRVTDHGDKCMVCGNGGVLICCDTCVSAFYLDCIKPYRNRFPKPKDPWRCSYCISSDSNVSEEECRLARSHKEEMEVLRQEETMKSAITVGKPPA